MRVSHASSAMLQETGLEAFIRLSSSILCENERVSEITRRLVMLFMCVAARDDNDG